MFNQVVVRQFPQARWYFPQQSPRHTLQATQVVVGYSGWRLPDGLMAQRGGGIAGSLNEARWSYAPTGRKGIAQGKAKRRPGIGVPETTQALKGRNRRHVNRCAYVSPFQGFGELERRRTQRDGVRPRVALRTQGGASLYPGLSHFAPLGRGDDGPSYEVRWPFVPTRWTGSMVH